MVILTILTQIDILFIPNSEDFVQESMKTLFTLTPRICLGCMIAYLISNSLDIFLYEMIKELSPDNRFIWLRNNVATMISQFIDTLIFTYISFAGIFSPSVICQLCITTYLVKILIAICDTPFFVYCKLHKPIKTRQYIINPYSKYDLYSICNIIY